MKCTKCGKNEVSYHFMSNINGKKTEEHLCKECAAGIGLENGFFSGSSGLFDGFFDDVFSGGLFGGDFMSPMRRFDPFGAMGIATMLMPRIFVIPERAGDDEKAEKPADDIKADPELSRRREINMLREKMHAAAEKEDYEEAARLRDELKKLGNPEK